MYKQSAGDNVWFVEGNSVKVMLFEPQQENGIENLKNKVNQKLLSEV